MNIDSQLRNLLASYPSHAPQADMQHRAPRAQQESQISYAGNDAKSPASNAVGNGHATKSEANSLRSLLDRLLKMLEGSTQRKTQPDAQASNAASSGSNTNANNQGNPANRANGSVGSNTQRGEQPYRGQSVDEPKNGSAYSADDLVDGFRQKEGTMNCVTVGGIKAAMQKFGGPKEIYSSVEKKGDGYDVKMRDDPNKTYHVTDAELKEAAGKSGFEGNNQQMLNDANFMYAVSAKRAQQENNDGTASHSFSAALNSLNTWENTTEGLERLGLKNHIQATTAQDLANGAAGVMAQNDHVFTVLNGAIENYGSLAGSPASMAQAFKLR